MMSESWTKRRLQIQTLFIKLLPYNNHEFIIVPQPDKAIKHCDGVYKFNTITTEWIKLMDFPNDDDIYESSEAISTIDNTNNMIYTHLNGKLWKFNLTTKSITVISNDTNIETYPGILLINGKIHLFQDETHLEFDENDEKFTVIHDFSKHNILSWIHNNATREGRVIGMVYHEDNAKIPVSIKEFKHNVWNDLKVPNCENLFRANMTETTRGDYWIFVGGTDVKTEQSHNFMHVYNIRKHTLIKSDILLLPQIQMVQDINPSIITSNDDHDNLLTFGFVKKCYKKKEFKDIQTMPVYLIKFNFKLGML